MLNKAARSEDERKIGGVDTRILSLGITQKFTASVASLLEKEPPSTHYI
jgi:hypothetical protein